MPIQKKFFIPMAVVLMGSFSFHSWKSELSPNIKRELASGAEQSIDKENEALSEQQLEKLSLLAVDIERAKQDIQKIKKTKYEVEAILKKDDLKDYDIEGLRETLTRAEDKLQENSRTLNKLEQAHSKGIKSLVEKHQDLQAQISKLSDSDNESQNELDKKIAELESLEKAMEKLKIDLTGSQQENKGLEDDLEKARAQIEDFEDQKSDLKAAYCQQKTKVSDLEEKIAELLKDKKEVAEKVVEIAEDKDSLNSKIDQLREKVSPKEEVLASQEFDVTAVMDALTSLSQQLQFNSQMLAMQRFQMPDPSSYFPGFRPRAQSITPYFGFNNGDSLFPSTTGHSFAPGRGFDMVRPYGSSLIGQGANTPQFDFGSFSAGLQSRYPAAPRSQAGSTFFDFNTSQ